MTHHTHPYSEEHKARAAWTYLAEARDTIATGVVATMGAQPALEWICSQSTTPPQQLWEAAVAAPKKFDDAIQQWKTRVTRLETDKDLDIAHHHGARFIIPSDPQWPEQLCVMGEYQPFGLWVKGNIDALGATPHLCVSIVGCRASSNYGEEVAATISWDLAKQGWTIVSGGAFGIDSVCHRATINAGGTTVAVTAGGIDDLYPVRHKDMFDAIVDSGGTIVTLHPPRARPTRWRFLDRNRLIAGLSAGTIVVEAGLRSGALNTASHARTMGTHVGAVPGSVLAPTCAGTNKLIRDGAVLVQNATEIQELLSPVGAVVVNDRPEPDGLWDAMDDDERIVYDALPKVRMTTTERVTRAAGLSPRKVVRALGGLEMKGFIDRVDGQWKRHTSKDNGSNDKHR